MEPQNLGAAKRQLKGAADALERVMDELRDANAENAKLIETLRRVRFYLGGHAGNEIAQDAGALLHNTEHALRLVVAALGREGGEEKE